MKQRLWIVEMWNEGMGRWEPTAGASLTREEARRDLQDWRADNADDTFRVCRYERQTREGR